MNLNASFMMSPVPRILRAIGSRIEHCSLRQNDLVDPKATFGRSVKNVAV